MPDVPDGDEDWELTVALAEAGARLDALLARSFPRFSRSRVKDLIGLGAVAINGQTATEASRKVKAGELVVLTATPLLEAEPEAEDIPLDVLYEDEHLIVVNKPAGMVVHPAPGCARGTLVNALLHHCGGSLSGINGVKRPGIVHRLDKDTSGVMVAAKTEAAHRALAAQFADHGRTGPLHRAYLALAWGSLPQSKGKIDAPIGRDQHSRLKQAVRREGREAITHYRVENRYGGEGWDITRVRCELETGRTHQIRVHLAHIGHPLVADPVYASGFATKINRLPEHVRVAVAALGRQALHAGELGFEHPVTGEPLLFSSPLPPDLAVLAQALAPYNLAGAR